MAFTPDSSQELAIEITASDEGASGAFSDVAGSAIDMKTAVAGAGGVLAGIGAAGLASSASAAADFEQAMADVEKVTDAQTAEELSDSIQDLAGEIPLAHEELAELATQAGRMGAEGTEEIEDFTRVAAQMGSATTLSADEAGVALGKMASALDEPLDNVEELGDAINELSNNFQTDSSEIVDSAQRSGQALDTLGLQSDEILGLSAAFNEVSPTSQIAAQRMQQVSEAMMDPDNVEMFADMLGVTAEEFEEMRDESPEETMLELMDTVDGNQEALDTLNEGLTTSQARSFRDTADSADRMREAMELSGEAMEENGSLANEVAVETDTFHGQMALLSNEIENVKIAIGEQLLPVIIEIVDAVRPAVQGFMDFNESLDGMPGLIGLIGVTLTGLGAIAVAVGPAIVSALSPILVPVAAIAAAVGVLYYAWSNNLGGIQEATEGLWDSLEPILNDIYETLMFVFEEYAMPLLERLADTFEEHLEAIMEDVIETLGVVQDRVETVLGWLEVFWDDHGEEIMTIVEMVFDFIELYIGTVMDAISTQIRVILALIRGDWREALDIIWDFVETTFTNILEFLGGSFLDGIGAILETYYNIVTGVFEGIYDFLIGNSIVRDTFNEIIEFVTEVFFPAYRDFWMDVFSLVKDMMNSVTDWLSEDAVSAFTQSFRAIGDAIFGVIDSIESTIRETFSELASWVLDTITEIVDDAVDAFNRMVPDTLEIPEVTVGGGTVEVPSATLEDPISGKEIGSVGGQSLSIPSETMGGQSMNLPQLAEGGIITSDTIARIGEAGEKEAVVPLQKLNSFLDTAYEAGRHTVSETPQYASSGSRSTSFTARLVVDGDDDLAEIIRENAELVIEENEQSKSNRIQRM
ncbi:phage tail tape measure protein [Halobacteria archaeon AArc-curdl1]|uniref:Phage tail tape measure protein n=1 Tax=Natronosalvus hydrolyticus TaxID=2979988 RepID=A0AAP2ZBQ9_9EURY|nr:phage tail tape measure protein [Halobacteria archaeon AArc-curdl1]